MEMEIDEESRAAWNSNEEIIVNNEVSPPAGFSDEQAVASDDEEEEYEDYSHLFQTELTFDSYQDALKWVNDIGHKHFMYFSVSSSKKNCAYIGCERKGAYVDPPFDLNGESVSKKRRRSKGTKKCGCPFQVNLKEKLGKWHVSVGENRGRHNHALGKYKHWHPSYVKLNEADMADIKSLSDSNMKPQHILNRLRFRHEGLNLRQINNAKVKLAKEISEDHNSIELLMNNLTLKNYSKWDIAVDEMSLLRDIVFANPNSIKFLRKFPDVLIMDGTYSTNKHKMPLIEIIGASPTGHNFHVAFAFVSSEVTDSFLFVMRVIEQLYAYIEGDPEKVKGPRVIVTDHELACMNAISTIFPEAKHLLYRRHIADDVRKYVTNICTKIHVNDTASSTALCKVFSKRWYNLVRCGTLEKYEAALAQLDDEWNGDAAILKYVHSIWLTPYCTRFLSVWIDDVMQYGNDTTNRVEGAHSQLKNWLGTARGILDTCFKKINELVEMQINEIKTRFEASRAKDDYNLKYVVYRLMKRKVTHDAINILLAEGATKGPCACTLPITHGLPCKCRCEPLANLKRPVTLDMVDKFWRTFDMEVEVRTGEPARPSAKEVAEAAFKAFSESASEQSLYMTSKYLHTLTIPESCEYEEPNTVKAEGRPKNAIGSRIVGAFEKLANKAEAAAKRKQAATKKKEASGLTGDGVGRGTREESVGVRGRSRGRGGRGRGGKGRGGRGISGDMSEQVVGSNSLVNMGARFRYRNEIPQCIIDFIDNYVNVLPDDNCGYHGVAWWRYGGEDRWNSIRIDCYEELIGKREFWTKIINDVDGFLDALKWNKSPCLDTRYWMNLTNVGLVVVTIYQAVVICYSSLGSQTYLPLRCDENECVSKPNASEKEFGLALIRSKAHFFFCLEMDRECPMPPLYPRWKKLAEERIGHWEDHFAERMLVYSCMEKRKKKIVSKGVIVID